MVKDLQQTLENYQQELEGSQQSKALLEKECVIYQSQLQVSGLDSSSPGGNLDGTPFGKHLIFY